MRIQVLCYIVWMSLGNSLIGFAQGLSVSKQGTVYGLITDSETGEPLALAHVRVNPLNTGSVSDEDGRY